MVGPPRKKKSLPLFFLENIKKGGRNRVLAPEAGSVTAPTTIGRMFEQPKIGYRYPLTTSNRRVYACVRASWIDVQVYVCPAPLQSARH